MLLAALATTSGDLAATAARSARIERLARALAEATPAEVPLVVAYLSGELPQRRTGLGPAALRDLPPAAQTPTLTVAEVDAAFARIAAIGGTGSTAERRRLLHALLARATAPEQRLLAGLVTGELRHGALEGLMVEAVARAGRLPVTDVRRALMLRGDLREVATAALTDGAAGLAGYRLQVGRPLLPMLAGTAADVTEAVGRLGAAALEWKLDGIRVQVHRRDDDVAVFTRTLDDVTARLPELVELARGLPARSLVLDGEALVLGPDGRPAPFQQTAARTASSVDVAAARARAPLSAYFFDLLHLDGADLLGEPTAARHAALDRVLPAAARVPRVVTDDPAAAAQALADALGAGHEGLVAKALDAPYEAGRRGGAWLKVKPRHTLDLVVLAAEWGHGRRTGWLSNLHLGARDPATGGFVMLGKTFKGLTDAMLAWQTDRLLELATDRGSWVVRVRPELVVEVAFDGVQTSPRYPAGMALRFARVLRHRPDKPAAQADTVDAVRRIHGGTRPGAPRGG